LNGGKPQTIVSDNGSELTSTAILKWIQTTAVAWHYIAPYNFNRPRSGARNLPPALYAKGIAIERGGTLELDDGSAPAP
jgi:putative transposase